MKGTAERYGARDVVPICTPVPPERVTLVFPRFRAAEILDLRSQSLTTRRACLTEAECRRQR